MSDVGDLHLGTVVVNVADMARAVDFWCAALGYRPHDTHTDPARFRVLVDPQRRWSALSLQLADASSPGPGRLHLDLYTGEQERHVERLVALGATRVPDWPYPDDPDFVVLRDPDGNEFCVIDHPELWGVPGRRTSPSSICAPSRVLLHRLHRRTT